VSAPRFLTLDASGRRFGSYVWAERRLFEVLGAWSGDTDDPAARPMLAANAAHHAWRATVLADRLPRARGLDVGGWVGAPNEAVAEALAVMARPGPSETTARLVGVYRVVVPALVEAFGRHLDLLTEIADAPSIRWLWLVLADELDDLGRGEALLAGRDVATPAVGAHRERLAGLLTGGGGIAGKIEPIGPVQDPSGDEQSGTTFPPTDPDLQ
jgi:hypothetical protein